MRLLPILALLAFFAPLLQAQEEATNDKPVLPSGPLIQKRAPDDSRWTVTSFTSTNKPPGATSAAAPAGNPKPNSNNTILSAFTITKTGNLIHVAWTDWNGEVWNIWVQGRLQAFVWPGGKRIGVPAAQPPSVGSNNKFGNPLFQDFTDSDFHGFEWISPANFTGIQLIGGRKCLVFKTTATYLGTTYPVVAATDFETRLPVQLQGYGEITVYRFQQVADGSQSLPDAVQKYFNSLPQAAASSAPAPY